MLGVISLDLSGGSTVAVWLTEYRPLFHLKSWDKTQAGDKGPRKSSYSLAALRREDSKISKYLACTGSAGASARSELQGALLSESGGEERDQNKMVEALPLGSHHLVGTEGTKQEQDKPCQEVMHFGTYQ